VLRNAGVLKATTTNAGTTFVERIARPSVRSVASRLSPGQPRAPRGRVCRSVEPGSMRSDVDPGALLGGQRGGTDRLV
jgi:hypothetical protein